VTWLPADDLLAPGAADLDVQLKPAAERLGTASPAAAASGRPPPPPLLVATGDRLVRRRTTCCLNDTVAASPCASCPLLPVAETRRRLGAR
jgi:hypothetical protein